jgi:hypothetical protein
MVASVSFARVEETAAKEEETLEMARSRSRRAAWTVVAFELANSSKTPTRYAPLVWLFVPTASKRMPLIERYVFKRRAVPVALEKFNV